MTLKYVTGADVVNICHFKYTIHIIKIQKRGTYNTSTLEELTNY